MRTFIAIGLVLVAVPSYARTWIVDQGGGGDFTLVREAVLAAGPGDSILVRPGTYDEYDGTLASTRATHGPLTLRGGGAGPLDTSLRFSIQFFHIDAVVENLRIYGEGSPLHYSAGTLVVRDCVLEGNESTLSGGGAIRGDGSLFVQDCSFYGNKSTDPRYESNDGGAIRASGPAVIRRSVFIGNESGRFGGAIDAGELRLEDCIFIGNKSDHGAAVSVSDLQGMHRCTLFRNEVRNGAGAALETHWGDWSGQVSHSIIAGTINGWGVDCGFYVNGYRCSDLWGNERGDFGGSWCGLAGVFSEDPLFCDPDDGDVGLLEGSPCLPGQHDGVDCGVVGARGLGCVDTPVEAVTWGKMRWLFR